MLATSSENGQSQLKLFDLQNVTYRGDHTQGCFQQRCYKLEKKDVETGLNDLTAKAEFAAISSIALIAKAILHQSLESLLNVTLTGERHTFAQPVDSKACWTIKVSDELKFTKTGSLKAQGGIFITAKNVNQSAKLKSGNNFSLTCDDLQMKEGSLIEALGDVDLEVKNLDNSNSTLLSTQGSMAWRGGKKATLINCGGIIQAKGNVNLGLGAKPDLLHGQLINRGGLILSEQKAVNLSFDSIENHQGTIKARDLDFKYQNLANEKGQICASRYANLLIKKELEGENSAQDTSNSFLNELRPGKIVSKEGGIYIVSQRPLLIKDNLVSHGLLKVVVDGKITNFPGIQLCSQQKDILFYSSGQRAGVDLQNCELQAQKIDFGTQSSVKVENANGRGDISFKVKGDLQLRSINFDMKKEGIKIEPSEMGKVEISNSQIRGGSFSILPSGGALQAKEVLIKDSRFELSDFSIKARRFQFDNTTVMLLQKMNAVCDDIFSAHSSIRSQGECSLRSDQNAIVDDLYINAHKIGLRSEKGRIEANSVLFWSKNTIAVQALKKKRFSERHDAGDGENPIFCRKNSILRSVFSLR